MITDHLKKDNLHHAYLVEGDSEKILPDLREFADSINIEDITEFKVDTLKIEDARNIKSLGSEKSFSGRRIFIISANSFLLEAQNTLLKLFEEPIYNTTFFVIVPDKNALLKTLVSRFYVIPHRQGLWGKEAEEFLRLSASGRLDFIKNLLAEEDEEEVRADSPRSKSLDFLNSLESTLHEKMSKGTFDTEVFTHFFKARKYLRMPGSSAKNLLESVALIVPKL